MGASDGTMGDMAAISTNEGGLLHGDQHFQLLDLQSDLLPLKFSPVEFPFPPSALPTASNSQLARVSCAIFYVTRLESCIKWRQLLQNLPHHR